MFPQPPPWLFPALLLVFALPMSAVAGLAATWLFDRLNAPKVVTTDPSARRER